MSPILQEFRPLRQETIDTIRARIDANVNAGLDEADPRWQETIPGGFFWDITQAVGLEVEYLWDFASTELPASVFLPFSWGIYLDYWGELLDRPRKQPSPAKGTVRLTNESTTTAQSVPTGLEVAAPATDPTETPLTFITTQAVTIPAEGHVDVQVQATETGSHFNVAKGAITLITSPSSELAVENTEAVSGGEDEELDEPYKERLLLEFQGSRGGGTKDDYIAQTLALENVGNVVVEPHWAGPNTVRIIISDFNNEPLSSGVIEAVQDFWDPPPSKGTGEGEAPIDADVTVATVSNQPVALAATLVLEQGFTLTGAGGTVDLSEQVEVVLRAYFHTLKAGHTVQINRVLSALLAIDGVYDVKAKTLQLNGEEKDVSISPLHSAQLGALTLGEEPAP